MSSSISASGSGRHDHAAELDPQGRDQERKRTRREWTPPTAAAGREHGGDLVDETQVAFAAEPPPTFE
jgi:hypothetical protein